METIRVTVVSAHLQTTPFRVAFSLESKKPTGAGELSPFSPSFSGSVMGSDPPEGDSDASPFPEDLIDSSRGASGLGDEGILI